MSREDYQTFLRIKKGLDRNLEFHFAKFIKKINL